MHASITTALINFRTQIIPSEEPVLKEILLAAGIKGCGTELGLSMAGSFDTFGNAYTETSRCCTI